MAIEHEKCSKSVTNKEMEIKAIPTFHYTASEMTIIPK